MARQSRPPGFDMTYRPEGAVSFGPPIRDRLPTLAYLGFALAIGAVIVYGQNAPSNTRIFQYVVGGDQHRLVSSTVCAIILVASGVAALVRDLMRGVIVHPDGIEMRELLPLGLPRIRRFHWSQIDRFSLPAATAMGKLAMSVRRDPKTKMGTIRIDLWDGSRTWLPEVARTVPLALMLEKVALARAIPVEGGTGLLDDLGD
jgi:hypothetical protein